MGDSAQPADNIAAGPARVSGREPLQAAQADAKPLLKSVHSGHAQRGLRVGVGVEAGRFFARGVPLLAAAAVRASAATAAASRLGPAADGDRGAVGPGGGPVTRSARQTAQQAADASLSRVQIWQTHVSGAEVLF